MMVKGPGSPARSASSNQTDSVLTESTDDESNFIALLQYKDAFHLLGLKGDGTTKQSDQQVQHRGISSPPYQQEAVEQHNRRRQVGSPKAQPQKEHVIRTQEPRSTKARSLTKDEDDLDTIDIYFNSPKNTNEPKAYDQSDAVSLISWDASSIFSMISNAKTNEDAASESGLSDVLGSLNKCKDKNDNVKGSVAAPKSSMLRPPLSINRAITSPRSITDFSPSIHDQGRYKEVDHPRRKKIVTARGRFNRAGPQSTTDAVRQGVMRALDEEDSECVSLDFEDGYPQIASKQKTIGKENWRHETIRAATHDRKSTGVSHRGGQQLHRGRDDASDQHQGNDVGNRCDMQRPKHTEPILEDDFYDSLIQSGMDGYNAVLESSIHISNQLCDVLQTCWVDGGNTDEASAADEGSAADDQTGVYTDGESTAFNTLSSFSKCGSTGEKEGKILDLSKRRFV